MTSGPAPPAGDISLNKYQDGIANCQGMAFSPDGKELAGILHDYEKYWLLCWNVADARLLDQHPVPKGLERQIPGGTNHSPAILWFPSRDRWLLYGHFVFDRKIGAPVWTIPQGELTLNERRVLDDHRVAVVSGPHNHWVLQDYRLPEEAIAKSAQAVSAGGLPADADLPPLTVADITQARTVSLEDPVASWNVQPDPSPLPNKALLPTPIALEAGRGIPHTLLLAPGNVGKAVVAYEPKTSATATLLLDHFDLASSRHIGSVEIPLSSQLLAYSPDGAHVLLRAREGQDRLDVWSIEANKHVVGWRPYQQDEKNKSTVTASSFVDANHVLTLTRISHR